MSTEVVFFAIPIFISLFAAWMLWGWCVGESKNIKWMRLWCAPSFVITAILISFGAGGLFARVVTRRAHRAEMTELFSAMRFNLESGRTQTVLTAIRETDMTGDPDASDFDLLKHLPEMTASLGGSEQSDLQVASEDTEPLR